MQKKHIVYIEDLAFGGDGVGRINKKVIFIKNTLPGDKVQVNITKNKRQYFYGEVIDFLIESPFRITPPCKYFYLCGGCALLHTNYFAQIYFKEKQIINTLQKFKCNYEKIYQMEKMDIPFYYRNKMEFSFGEDLQNNKIVLGMHKINNFAEIIDINNCLLQSIKSNEILQYFRFWANKNKLSGYNKKTNQGLLRHLIIREAKHLSNETMLVLSANVQENFIENELFQTLNNKFNVTVFALRKNTGVGDTSLFGNDEFLTLKTTITENILNKTFLILPKSFLQTNTMQMQKLYKIIKNLATETTAETVFDLYAGTSTIGCVIADAVKKVITVEENELNCNLAKLNIQANNIKNLIIINKKTEDVLAEITEKYKPQLIILDPPRAGLHTKTIKSLLNTQVESLIYVSCNLQTFARDLNLLQQYYFLDKLYSFDMFPHTYHLETVALIKLKQN